MLGTASPASATEADAKLAFKAGRYGTAVQKFSELLLLDPDSHVQLCNRSAALLKLGLPAAAASDARRAVKLSPSPHVKAHYRLACALECTGEWAEALQVVGKALLIQPHHPQLEAIRERCMRELTAPASVSVSASSRTRVTCRRPRPTEALAPRLDESDRASTVTSAPVALVSCLSHFAARCWRTLFRPLVFGLSAVCRSRRKFGSVAAAHHGHALGWRDTVLRLATSLFEVNAPASLRGWRSPGDADTETLESSHPSPSILTLPPELAQHILNLVSCTDLLQVRCVCAGAVQLATDCLRSRGRLFTGTYCFTTQRLHLMTSRDTSVGVLTLHADGSVDGAVQEGDESKVEVHGTWDPLSGRVILTWRHGRSLHARTDACLIHEVGVSDAIVCLNHQQWTLTGTWCTASVTLEHKMRSARPDAHAGRYKRWHELLRLGQSDCIEQGNVPSMEWTLLYQD